MKNTGNSKQSTHIVPDKGFHYNDSRFIYIIKIKKKATKNFHNTRIFPNACLLKERKNLNRTHFPS